MERDAARFRVLLAEDDPVSRDFLDEAIRGFGADVVACADGATTLDTARAERFDLLVLDHHLPGLGGDVLLATLRADPDARSRATPAIATSAAHDTEFEALLRAGFSDALAKPMTLDVLQTALARQGCPTGPALDDDAAVRACGSPESVARLRRLFAEHELPNIQRELDHADADPQSLRPALHRLRASCSLCGAGTLGSAAAALERALSTTPGDIRISLDVFRRALADTRASLEEVVQLVAR